MEYSSDRMIFLILLLISASGVATCTSAHFMRTVEPTGGSWSTILAEDPMVLDPPPSPGSDLAASEALELRELQARRTPEVIRTIEYWDHSPSIRWNEIARDLVKKHETDPPMASRVYALLSIAQYDALVMAWDNKYRYNRAAPADLDSELYPFVSGRDDPAYPSEHAAVAAASAEILKYLYPDEAEFLEEKARDNGESRMWAGASFRSDITSGYILGRRAAGAVIDHARSDGSERGGNFTLPEGPGRWTGANPTKPLWGEVRPYLIEDAEEFMPPPPPEYGSDAFENALSEVRSISDRRTRSQLRIADKWADGPGTATPPGHWNQIACQMIVRYHLSELRSARALALMNMAMMDAGICCWDAKYHYCLIRPWQADPEITTPVGRPSFPSYTSGHSAFSAAASEVLGYIFPGEKSTLDLMAEEAGISRLYGGIHYRFDIDEGAESGRRIARLAIRRGMTDGSPQAPIQASG